MQAYFLNKFYYSPSGDGGMISVDEAKEIVRHNVDVMPSIKMLLKDAVGYVLADAVYSKIDFPPFNQSNVDGYAIAFKDAKENLILNGESAAGSNKKFELHTKHAMRIFTGAPVPENADTVVMQEKTSIENNGLIIKDETLKLGINFRAKGKDILKDSIALKKDEYLSASAIGYLTALGVTEVNVYKRPSIGIIITGNELQQPGKDLQFGQVYESNSFMLKAVLHQMHFNDVDVYHAADNLEKLTSILSDTLNKSDVVLLCGGISVGDYDFVSKATENCGVKKMFHKVKQRPGKPLFFGIKEQKLVFGLPGNPSSVLTCFYEYVTEALAIITKRESFVRTTNATLQNDYTKVAGLTFFLKGLLKENKVEALDAQESYRLSSYAKANCLIRLDEERLKYKMGEEVEVHMI